MILKTLTQHFFHEIQDFKDFILMPQFWTLSCKLKSHFHYSCLFSGDADVDFMTSETFLSLLRHKMDADQIEKIAKDANDTSSNAYNLLLKTLDGEAKISQEVDDLNRK